MREIFKSGSVRGVKFFYKAEYCGTPQSKERRNREYKVCLNERALRLLDQTKPISVPAARVNVRMLILLIEHGCSGETLSALVPALC